MKLQSARAAPHSVPGVCLPFARALNGGDLDAAAACFARDGCLITPDATAIHGRESVRALLAQMVARRTKVLVEASGSIRGGEVILARERWRVRAGELEGSPIEQILSAVLILRRVEGAWKLAIAAPWGWDAAAL
jgi:ketosteroid isomerase-like protein